MGEAWAERSRLRQPTAAERMREIHAEGDDVIGAPRMHEALCYEGERVVIAWRV